MQGKVIKSVSGQAIIDVQTLKSWYDNGNILIITDKKEQFLMSSEVILQCISNYSFTARKKRKHTYLYPNNI